MSNNVRGQIFRSSYAGLRVQFQLWFGVSLSWHFKVKDLGLDVSLRINKFSDCIISKIMIRINHDKMAE